jgi:hypothetical protein
MTRATEVELVMRQSGFEKGTIKLLAELFERQSKLEQDMRENAEIILQVSTMMAQVVDGAGAMRQQVEKLTKGDDNDEDLPSASGH